MILKPRIVIDKSDLMDDYPRFYVLTNDCYLHTWDFRVIVHLAHAIFYSIDTTYERRSLSLPCRCLSLSVSNRYPLTAGLTSDFKTTDSNR